MDIVGLSLKKNGRQIMTFEFSTATIYDTVGALIQTSKQCRNMIRPRGIRNRTLHKLFDVNGVLVSEYHDSISDWKRLIKKDMHRIQKGTIESICSSHPC